MEGTVIKRPVFIVLSAFALGEIIAVFDKETEAVIFVIIAVLGWILAGIHKNSYLNKIIANKHKVFFAVVFFAAIIGWMVTNDAVRQSSEMYQMSKQEVVVNGSVSRVQMLKFGWRVYLQNVELSVGKSEKAEKNSAQKISNETADSITENIRYYNRIIVEAEELSDIKIGNIIEASGKLEQFDTARNPGNFDEKKYYMSLGIYGKISADKIVVINNNYNSVKENLNTVKSLISEKLKKLCDENGIGIWKICKGKAAVFEAMLLGERAELDKDIKDLYSEMGIAHILAISGLHISFIGMFFYRLLRLKFRFGISAVVSITVVAASGMISGMGIAAVRAIVMFGLRLLGEVLGRTYDSLTAISTAGLMLLLWNPFVIFNSGFHMSFAAIIAITLVWDRAEKILKLGRSREEKLPVEKNNITHKQKIIIYFIAVKEKITDAIALSITIGIVMNPIVAYSYYQLPLYSFLLNIIVVPLMSVVIVSGVAAVSVSFISVYLGRVIVLAGCFILEFYTVLCKAAEKFPGANIIVGQPSVGVIAVYYIVLAAALWILLKVRNNIEVKVKEHNNIIPSSGKVIESKYDRLKEFGEQTEEL